MKEKTTNSGIPAKELQRSEESLSPQDAAHGPTLQQLRELIVGQEIQTTKDLQARVEKLQSTGYLAEHLAEHLAEALRDREKKPDEFEDLAQALQASTESAIQRSVNVDKEPLTKALFPIMGPAIRTYVLELFRGLSEELNRSIQNATSAERMKWRVQAKLAGKPYSEYVLLKTRSFQVEEVYLMQRDTGLLLLHSTLDASSEVDGEADLVSGMFTAIRSFVKDSFARGNDDDETHDDKELDSFTFGDREVLIEVGPSLVLAAVILGVPSPEARNELKRIHEQLHAELNPSLEDFSGDTSELESSRPLLRQALIESSAETTDQEDSGGLWRVWLILGIIGTATLSVLVLNFLEQRNWNHFEKTLRAEPGIAVTQVERTGWWRKRRIHGLRDPLAKKPPQIARELELNLERIAFDFKPMVSMQKEFALPRQKTRQEELQTLQAKIDELENKLITSNQNHTIANEANMRFSEAVLKSALADLPNLQYEILSDKIRLWGELSAPDLTKLTERLAPLQSIRTIDTSGLSKDTKLEDLLKELAQFSLRFDNSTFDQPNAVDSTRLSKLLQKINQAAAETGTSYRYTILSHPLIGKNRNANRVIEQRRIEQLRAQVRDTGLKLDLLGELSEDLNKAGGGIIIRAEQND